MVIESDYGRLKDQFSPDVGSQFHTGCFFPIQLEPFSFLNQAININF